MPILPAPSDISTSVHLGPNDLVVALKRDVLNGLTATPKNLPPKWLYDDRGCDLFDQITRLPEYYPTRCERAILTGRAAEIAAITRADTLVELGSGTSEKTRLLLGALSGAGTLRRFVPFDVAEATMLAAAESIVSEYPGVDVHAVVGDFERHIPLLPRGGRRLIAFLGGTIGNLHPPERARLLAALADGMETGDALLLGTDLVKDRARLVAAYDDAAGVTAAFNLNVLAVLNRELRARFEIERFQHVALFDDEHEHIEMRLRSLDAGVVPIAALELDVAFEEGEEMRTEISTKFHPDGVRRELEAAGLEPARFWTDPAGDFGLSLALR